MTDPGFAPAKVNLYLHVGPPADDGYHPLSSLVVFADVGDHVTVARSDAPRFLVQGPFARALAGEGDNLCLRALTAFERAFGRPVPPLTVVLDKRLPIAAGLGGGSSDGAAALRLLARAFGERADDPRLVDAAESLGADGAMCLAARPAIAEGRGERLSIAPGLPSLHAVLVNPAVPSPTGAVYRTYDEAPHPAGAERPRAPQTFDTAEDLAAWLQSTRNDLEPPALRLQPAISDALDLLRDQPEALFVRMSGSGATVFALCRDGMDARTLAERVHTLKPDWWTSACRLG